MDIVVVVYEWFSLIKFYQEYLTEYGNAQVLWTLYLIITIPIYKHDIR